MYKVQILGDDWCKRDYANQAFKDLGFTFDFEFTDSYQDILILQNDYVSQVENHNNKTKIAWLQGECKNKLLGPYTYVVNNAHKFDLIFTFDKFLLASGPKFRFCPFGSTWMSQKQDRQLFKKTKNVSMIGNTRWIGSPRQGHQLRDSIIDRFKNRLDAYHHHSSWIPSKLPYLQDFRYYIAVESDNSDYWITEKLIDCFKTGTIPIYWGCESMFEMYDFDPNGVLAFSTLDELELILNTVSKQDYEQRFSAVTKNFEIANKYTEAYWKKYLWCNGIGEFF